MKYALQRFLQLIPILFGITFLSFLLMYMAGSDAVTEMYSNRGAVEVAQEIIDAGRFELGLNLPSSAICFLALGDAAWQYGRELHVTGGARTGIFSAKLPATLLLTAASIVLTIVISIPLGIVAAIRHDKTEDLILRFSALSGMPCQISSWDAAHAVAWYPA